MRAFGVEFLLLFGVVGAELCEKHFRSRIEKGKLTAKGDLETEDGILHAKGTFWKDSGDSFWACPCLTGSCLWICNKDLIKRIEETFNVTFNLNSTIEIWDVNNSSRQVVLKEHFKLVQDSKCSHPVLLEPEVVDLDEHRILANGTLHYTHANLSEEYRFSDPRNFCVIPLDNSPPVITVCVDVAETPLKFYLYTPFFILSALFLLLTLVAYCFVGPAERKSLHNKTICCQSAALLIVYICLSITYLTGGYNAMWFCVSTTYFTYYFLLASFFWLNVMCVDMYLTFRSLTRTVEIKYWQASVYAWGVPSVFAVVMILADQLTTGPLSPDIGKARCWFNGFLTELLYFDGVIIILLVANVVLFGMTAIQLWRLRRESRRVLQTSNSRTHMGTDTQQNRDRLTLFFKMFLLMGCLWVMEVISWAAKGPDSYWYLTDILNSLRGVLIFWFCVWSKKSVRKALLGKITQWWKNPILETASPQHSTSNTGSTPMTLSTASGLNEL
ncbi:G-protein coupled receptor Mth2-like [Neocloeon triangulifer]|uniref:G-protein coupled receptor Mth2-like n=1 Tax=Neocloeon triangulifer TaxID=2078957 RepID=UPI00286EE4C8|nr:G-protein coupled receptor Mth2-like [Neocloeon triangulifer]